MTVPYELYLGDCLEQMDYIKDGSVDFILTDPPYGTTRNKWDEPLDLKRLWECYDRILKPTGVVALFAQPPFSCVLGMSNIKNLRYEWVWQKPCPTGFLNAGRMPLKAHELVLIFYRRLGTFNAQRRSGFKPYRTIYSTSSTNYGRHERVYTEVTDGTRNPIDVVVYKKDKEKLHPTQKPLALCEMLIKTYTNEGETVLDSCMGVGTTGLAALKNGRNFVGIELEPHYYDLASKRLAEATACPS